MCGKPASGQGARGAAKKRGGLHPILEDDAKGGRTLRNIVPGESFRKGKRRAADASDLQIRRRQQRNIRKAALQPQRPSRPTTVSSFVNHALSADVAAIAATLM